MEFKLDAGAFLQEENVVPFDLEKVYDVIIIGGGPAGLTSAVYCMRKGLSTGIIIKEIGGQMVQTAGIENYMGYRHINGMELVEKFREQVIQFGIAFEAGISVSSITDGKIKKVDLEDGREVLSRALIIATGKSSRKLNIPGEDVFTGKGVAYCSTCDAPFFTGKRVIVVGGGNSALDAANDLSKVAESVFLVHRQDKLSADQILIDRIISAGNIQILYNHEVVEIKGDDRMTSAIVNDRTNNKKHEIGAEGIFVEIGLIPTSEIARSLLDLTEEGEIKIDCSCKTSRPGIFAAGDVTTAPFKQIVVATGEGAKAALSASEYILRTFQKGE